MEHPRALFSIVKTKAGLILKCCVCCIVKPKPQEKFLIISDGHRSHTQSLRVNEIPRKH
jgi:hypothetical protein